MLAGFLRKLKISVVHVQIELYMYDLCIEHNSRQKSTGMPNNFLLKTNYIACKNNGSQKIKCF